MKRHPAHRGHGGVAVAALILGLVLLALAWAGVGGTLGDAAAQPTAELPECGPGEVVKTIRDRAGTLVDAYCVPMPGTPPLEDTPDAGDPSHACQGPPQPAWCPEEADAPAPTVRAYGGPVRDFPETSSGDLPFTGFDVALLVFGGFALVVVGSFLHGGLGRRLRRRGAR